LFAVVSKQFLNQIVHHFNYANLTLIITYYSMIMAWYYWVLAVNAILGAFGLTWALRKVRPNKLGSFHDEYPAYKRTDMDNYNYFILYFWAMTILIPRTILTIFILFLHTFIVSLVCLGHDWSKPLTGCREWYSCWSASITCYVYSFLTGAIPLQKKVSNFDYSEWLGPDYRDTIRDVRAATIVSNHTSFQDATIMTACVSPSFLG